MTAAAERRTVQAALAALTVLVSAACGQAASAQPSGADTATSSQPALVTARSAARDALLHRDLVSISFSDAPVFGGEGRRASAAGAFDLAGGLGTLEVRPAGRATADGVVFQPRAVFTRPASSAALPRGRSWFVADFSDTSTLTRNFPEFIAQVESINPEVLVAELAWGGIAARPGQSGVIDAMPASGVDVTVDLDVALLHLGDPANIAEALAVRAAITEIDGRGGARTHTTAMRAWIAGDGTLVGVETSPPAAGVGHVTMALRRSASAVTADAPAAALVYPVASLAPVGERENARGGDSDGG